MIRVAFVIGGYPPEEYKRRADVARAYSTTEIEVGIIDTKASPYFYGITPAEIQIVTPAYIESFKQAEREGYHAAVPLGMLDLGVDGGKSAVDIPVVGPMESSLHIASLLGDRFGLIIYHEKLLAFNRAIVRRYGMEERIVGFGVSGFDLPDITANREKVVEKFLAEGKKLVAQRGGSHYSDGHHPVSGAHQTRFPAGAARRSRS